MQLIEQLRAQLDVLNALIEEMRWRNERIAKAIASATAAERAATRASIVEVLLASRRIK
jgi:prefoldin subunit 5